MIIKILNIDFEFKLDIKMAEESINKITDFGVSEIVCYHGGKLELN